MTSPTIETQARALRIARTRSTAMLIALLCASAAACRETSRNSVLSPAPQRTPPTASLVVSRVAGNDTLFAASVQLASTEPLGRVGSLSIAVDYDSTRMHFVADSSPASDALRASHADRGRVRVAAASASGIAPESLARLLFSAQDTAALRTLRLEVMELHQLDASDLRRSLVVQSAPTVSNVVTP